MVFDMNLLDSATIPLVLIKRVKLRINKKTNFPHDTKWRIYTIAINNVWNTHIIQILREECDGRFHLFGNRLNILPNTVELSHEWVLMNFKYQDP